MKMIAGSIMCLAAAELAKGVLGGAVGGVIYLVSGSFLFLTGFGYFVMGAKEKNPAP